MYRRSQAGRSSVHGGMIVLCIALSLVSVGCAKNGSGDGSTASSDASPMVAATSTVATNDLMAKLPVYPGSAHAASQKPEAGAARLVTSDLYTTRDSFDKVYRWYRSALPAHSETSRQTSQFENLAVFTMSAGRTHQGVSILKTNGVAVTNITITQTIIVR
jgi:hypothetical protein